MNYRVVVTGGGTGGHIYPGIAIAKTFLQHYPQTELLYIGSRKGLETDIVPKTGLPFELIRVSGLPRRLSFQALKTLYLAGAGFGDALRLLRKFKPHIVVGTGGYVCGPVVMAAFLLGIPTLIQEQNALPGITNRVLGKFVNRVCLGFAEAARFFPQKKTVFTGNPLRPEMGKVEREEGYRRLGLNPGRFTFLVFGASQGAKSINRVMVEVLPVLLSRWENLQVIFITGKNSFDQIKRELENRGLFSAENSRLYVYPYLYQMAEAWAVADLVLCRAGALTIAELTCQGVPAVLVPFPYAAGDHQTYNARVLEKAGAAKMIADHKISPQSLLTVFEELYTNPGLRRIMAMASKKLGRSDAAVEIVKEMKKLITR